MKNRTKKVYFDDCFWNEKRKTVKKFLISTIILAIIISIFVYLLIKLYRGHDAYEPLLLIVSLSLMAVSIYWLFYFILTYTLHPISHRHCQEVAFNISSINVHDIISQKFRCLKSEDGLTVASFEVKKTQIFVICVDLDNNEQAYDKVVANRKIISKYGKPSKRKGSFVIFNVGEDFSFKKYFQNENVFNDYDCDIHCFHFQNSDQIRIFYFYNPEFCQKIIEILKCYFE